MTTVLHGTWDLKLKTPIGTLGVQYRFRETPDGIEGSASSSSETVPLENIVTVATDEGVRATWLQKVSKPMRLNLEFDVTFSGDTAAGHSRAGRLPRTSVTGQRTGDPQSA